MKEILYLTVNDRPGVLDRIVGLIRRRNWNIESLTVGDIGGGLAQITLLLEGRSMDMQELGDHLEDMDAVRSWRPLTGTDGLMRELLLFCVDNTETIPYPDEGVRLLEEDGQRRYYEFTGTPRQVEALVQSLRAGGIACARSGPLPLMCAPGEGEGHG